MKRQIIFISVLLTALLFSGCKYKFAVTTDPENAEITINGESYAAGETYSASEEEISISVRKEGYVDIDTVIQAEKRFSLNENTLTMELKIYEVTLSSFYNTYESGAAGNFRISIDGEEVETEYFEKEDRKFTGNMGNGTKFSGELNHGEHTVIFHADGYDDYSFPLAVTGNMERTIRHPKVQPSGAVKLIPLGMYDCGFQPKQVDITPDSRYLYIALLSDKGFNIFDTETMEMVNYVQVEKWGELEGFVEGLFIPKYNAYFISQMSTGYLFEYDVSDYAEPVFRRRLKTEGGWTKVMAYSDDLDMLAATNWHSYDVTIFDYGSGEIVTKITDLVEPRGVIFSNDGKYIYITTYLGGSIYKFNTSNWKQEGKINIRYSAQRHIRITDDDKTIYVSDMRYNKISVIDTETFTIEKEIDTDTNPNTIDMTEDEKYLFVSARGPNNEISYLKRSPEEGHVNIIDLDKQEVISRITAGTQPTGLDVAPDGSFFAVSNFQDQNFEIYGIEW